MLSRFFQKGHLDDLPIVPVSELRNRTRILLIDDEPYSFPVEEFMGEGYDIHVWERVESLSALDDGRYDIIILDIMGVARHLSEHDGFGILEHIKKVRPTQIVIVCSGHPFRLDKRPFWDMADDYLSKPMDFTTCKGKLDALIRSKISPEGYKTRLRQLLKEAGVPQSKISKIEKLILTSIGNKNLKNMEAQILKTLDHVDVAKSACILAFKIASLFV